ncbi:MAG: ABC transporter permease [Solobacterium sp.]|nr:ABC transporter permease [Solobacterium sp.]
MKKYILSRILRSIVSLFVLESVVIAMIFTLIPKTKILDNDQGYKKMTGDTKTVYRLKTYEKLGYLEYEGLTDMCAARAEDYASCLVNDTDENLRVVESFKNDGYVIEYLKKGKKAYAYHEYSVPELILHFWQKLINVDTPNSIQDENNPDLERKYYIGKDYNNVPALMCSGCTYKYQIYFGEGFPWIHQNMIRLDFGVSYPTKSGVSTMEVINENQGSQISVMQKFPTGIEQESPIRQHTCRYKPELDHLDQNKFTDHYADCRTFFNAPSMVNTSYLFGIVSLIIAYVIALPAGIAMARNKGKLGDKIGVVFINVVIAMPSLALIYFVRQIGTKFGLPDKFPLLGFTNIKSYIVPMVILAILSMPSLMTWVRRYMLDQSNADYVKFARAKGLSQREIFSRHILKNAIIPIVNGIPASVILCISGALITESAFAIPGMGKMLPDAINKMNNNMVLTLTFIFSALAIFAVLLGDILMTVVDPRIQLNSKGDDN